MNKRLTMRLLPLMLSSLFAVSGAYAQSTSATIGGTVTDAQGQPATGAEVTITHSTSGTISHVTTDASGRYSARGLRVGGPYKITITKDGQTETRENVYLQIGDANTVSASLIPSESLDTIVVTGTINSLFSEDKMGTGTNLNNEQIQAMPSAGRNIQDLMRLDPRIAQTSKADGRISAGGQNSRFNLIRIDGVSTNDPFGLEGNNLPTERQPVSIDAIEEVNIALANYDVTTAGATGAIVNAVTKSGTNDFHGSLYYAYRDKDMVRKDLEGVEFNGFNDERTYGGTFGGAIVKDKLFFFANYEKYIRTAPGTSLASTPYGRGQITDADIAQVQSIAQNVWGFDAGSLGASPDSKTEVEEYAVKFDWNISDSHRASLRYSNLEQSVLRQPGISNSGISLSSYWYDQPKTFTTYVGQLFSDWTDNFSTEVKVSYREYDALRATFSNLPSIRIYQNNQSIYLGTEVNSHVNIIDTNETSAFVAGSYFLGDHTLKFGVDFARNDVINFYGRDLNGSYTFQSIADFEAGTPSQYTVRTPREGRTYADIPADYRFENTALFLQDRWAVNYNLNLMFGVRVDRPNYPEKPIYNANIQSIYGYDNSKTISTKLWQPRFGFNYTFDTERPTQLRGGLGLFQGAAPNVWMSGTFQNTGLNFVSYDERNPGAIFDPSRVVIPDGPGAAPRQRVDLIEPGLALPSSWKANLAIDHELPWNGIVASAEFLVSKVKDDIYFESLDLGASTRVGPDGRMMYWNAEGYDPANADRGSISNGRNGVGNRANRPSSIDQVMLARNTDKGQSRQVTLSLAKPLGADDHWGWSAGYTYTHATQVSPMASSQNTSNWNGTTIFQVNENVAYASRYAIRDRFTGALTYQNNWFGDNKSSAGLFFEGRSGLPFTYIFGNDVNGDGANTNDLFYVPAGRGDVLFTGGQAMEDAFFDYLDSHPDLDSRRGRVVKANSSRTRWINNFDLRLSQEVPLFFEGHKAEITLDFMNIGNLFNKNWGKIEDYGFYQTARIANYAGVDPVTGKYVYYFDPSRADSPGIQENNNDKGNTGVSRWSIQATFHYRF